MKHEHQKTKTKSQILKYCEMKDTQIYTPTISLE